MAHKGSVKDTSSSPKIQNKELVLAWDKGFIEGMRQSRKFLTGKQDSLPDTPSPNPYEREDTE